MKKKKRERLYQVGMVIFLILIALGFTLPGFVDDGPSQIVVAEPRLCQNDADCYLLCEDVPKEVLCTKNMCVVNSCAERSYYPYNKESLGFTLAVTLNNKKINLQKFINPKDLFVKLNGETVNLYSSGLALHHVFEKLQMPFEYQCITLNSTQYCPEGEEGLQMFVNGEQSFAYDSYVPEEGNEIELIYS